MPSVERPISARFESMLRDVLRRLATLERRSPSRADPVGRVAWVALPDAPDGWLVADGSQVTTDYPVLRAALAAAGNPFGAAGGNPLLPNLVGRFPRGAGTGATLGATGGADSVTLTVAEMPSHTHVQNPHTHGNDGHSHPVGTTGGQYFIVNGTGGAGGSADIATGGGGYSQATPQPVGITIHDATATNQHTGGGAAHENRPPYVNLTPIVRAY